MSDLLSGNLEQGDHDLRTILALYDSSELLSKLEEAVRVLVEMIPSGLVDQEELLDDALAVVCGDLCQLLELGIKDPTLTTILSFLDELRETSSTNDHPTHISKLSSRSPSVEPEIALPHPAVDPARREVLFAAIIALFKCPGCRQRFLTFLEDDSLMADMYLSFAPLRSHSDCMRISRALRTLPNVDMKKSNRESSERPPEMVKPADEVDQGPVPSIIVESPVKSEPVESTLKSAEISPVSPLVRTKPTLHTRSRSNLDNLPVTRTPTRRLSFSRPKPSPRDRDLMAGLPAYFSPPRPGQSLIGYLKSQDTETCADLERENAHFFVSDVIIAAVEQMQYERRHGVGRWSRSQGEMSNVSDEDVVGRFSVSRDGVEELRGRGLRTAKNLMTYREMVSDGQSSTIGTTSGSLEEEDERPTFSLAPSETPEPQPSSSTAPTISPVSDQRSSTKLPREVNWRGYGADQPSNSAEAIAVSLLRKFKEHHLPTADEMDWLVSESDVPQRLLPLPNSTFISPDAGQSQEQYRIRGNLEWAPLRPQIIYHIQPHVILKVGMVNQKNRCAGCGGKMDSYQRARMRFCEYTGKYFCVCCHEYKTSVIPARVLLKWDFTKHYVSNFAYDFMARIYRDPLFDVSDCNMDLYKRSKSLMQTRLIRTQLVLATEYIRTCRSAESAMAEVQQLPTFIYEQIHTYSLDLFGSVKDGVLPAFLKPVAELAVHHVINCEFCCSKGFICEFCRDATPLFPFQFSTVYHCEKCFACYHNTCIKKKPCPKCARLQARKSASPTETVTA